MEYNFDVLIYVLRAASQHENWTVQHPKTNLFQTAYSIYRDNELAGKISHVLMEYLDATEPTRNVSLAMSQLYFDKARYETNKVKGTHAAQSQPDGFYDGDPGDESQHS